MGKVLQIFYFRCFTYKGLSCCLKTQYTGNKGAESVIKSQKTSDS